MQPMRTAGGVQDNPFPGYVSSGKPVAFIQAGIHSREWVSHSTSLYIAHKLLSLSSPAGDSDGEQRGSGSTEQRRTNRQLLDALEFVVVPAVNVDGYVHTW